MNRFEIISQEQFNKDFEQFPQTSYNDLKKPARATMGSAGYDLYAPFDITLAPGETIKIPTGIRVILDGDKFLAIAPRSGLGFKFRLQLDNTIGIIDSDYCGSSNEGHIWAKITNDGREGKTLSIAKGEGFAQAIVLPFFLMDDDDASGVRDGGFGSTTQKAK